MSDAGGKVGVSSKRGGVGQGGLSRKWGSDLGWHVCCNVLFAPPDPLSSFRPLLWAPGRQTLQTTTASLVIWLPCEFCHIVPSSRSVVSWGEAFCFSKFSRVSQWVSWLDHQWDWRSRTQLVSCGGPWQINFKTNVMAITFNTFSLCIVYHTSV